MKDLAIEARGLTKRYGKLTAVDGLDLEVRRGECFGLLGPNGAGKTTTVEILEGLTEPDGGRIEILRSTWADGGQRLRERIGVQLQETKLTEKLTALETVRLFRSFYPSGAAALEVLRSVGLEEKAGTWVRKLSGGQRQRLSLACALVGEPELLFLDEPTTGLDPASRRRTWEIVEAFRDRGGTVLLTTHYMEEAARLCQRVMILDRGRSIALGSPRELIASLGAEHVVEIRTGGAPNLEALRGLSGVRRVDADDGLVRLTVSEVHAALPALLGQLDRDGIDLTELTTHHATLEDVFVSLTGRHLRDG